MEGFMQLGIFGDLIPMEETKKETKKKADKKADKKPAPVKKEEAKYTAPIKLVFDSIDSLEISEGTFTKKELFGKVHEATGVKLFKENETKFEVNKLQEGTYLVRPSYSCKYVKGCFGKNLLLEQMQTLTEIIEVEDESAEITAEAVKTFVTEKYGIDVTLYAVGDTYIPVPDVKEKELEEIKFPLNISALTLFGEMLEVSEEEYLEFKKEFECSETAEENEMVSKEVIKKILETYLPDYPDMVFGYDQEKSTLQVGHKAVSGATAAASAKKEDTYPTDATVSLVFTRMELTPEFFGGKKEVTKNELLKHIAKTYPEYSAERTDILFDKKKNLIIPTLRSGKRGAEDYLLEDGPSYRREVTPLMSVMALKEPVDKDGCVNGLVYYNLPKIPFDVLKKIMNFFWSVYIYKRTEAIAMIFWNKENESYETYIPEQTASYSDVEFERDTELELDQNKILVMEIHSHGFHKAFWSGTDNYEERAHRLYAVAGEIGDFMFDNEHLKIRACTGGRKVKVKAEEIFEFPKKVEEFHPWLGKIQFDV